MFPLPSPLHPAVVHFPIVLLLLGAAVAVVSIFVNRWHLTWISASLLVMGALGAFVAVETGEMAQEIVGQLAASSEDLLDSHQEWAERTEMTAGITAAIAIFSAALGVYSVRLNTRKVESMGNNPSVSSITRLVSRPAIPSAARAITAVAALLSCFFVYQTARRGGELVYEHGVGVNVATGQLATPTHGHNKD